MPLGEFLTPLLEDVGALFRQNLSPPPEFTPRAQQVFALARYEAVRRHHERIGVSHLLFALVQAGKNTGFEMLSRMGADTTGMARELESHFVPGRWQSGETQPYSRSLKKCLAFATREADSMNHRFVGTDHLLLGLLRVGEEPVPGFFARHGLNLARMREAIRAQAGREQQANE